MTATSGETRHITIPGAVESTSRNISASFVSIYISSSMIRSTTIPLWAVCSVYDSYSKPQ